MPIYDISVPISDKLVTWPGDPGIQIERSLDLACGDNATVSLLHLGSHTGTHVDAFSHFKPQGQTLDQWDLSVCLGPARVVEMADPACITVAELERYDWQGVTRVLFKTQNSSQPWFERPFDENFCHITPDAADFLVARGIRLVGIDYLSVEGFRAEEWYGEQAPTHHRLMDGGVYIVEGLYLKDIAPGDYELICLPLLIQGGDGGPARVVLRDLPG